MTWVRGQRKEMGEENEGRGQYKNNDSSEFYDEPCLRSKDYSGCSDPTWAGICSGRVLYNVENRCLMFKSIVRMLMSLSTLDFMIPK